MDQVQILVIPNNMECTFVIFLVDQKQLGKYNIVLIIIIVDTRKIKTPKGYNFYTNVIHTLHGYNF